MNGAPPPLSPSLLAELRRIVRPENVLDAVEDRLCYAYDATWLESLPQAVVLPRSVEAVAGVLRVASAEGVPVVPRGASSGLAGGSVPIRGGIVLNLSQLNRIVEIDRVNSCVVAEPGVITLDLQRAVEAQGLFYPPDPASLRQSTIGGNVATGAGGPRGVKYGTTKDYVLGLQIVTPQGDVFRCGGKTVKNAAGYKLPLLYCGSEGTLGVITEVTMRLLPLPQARRTLRAVFPSLEQACSLVPDLLGSGVVPVMVELLDRLSLRCVDEFLHLGFPVDAEAMILVEVDGDEAACERDIVIVAERCRALGAVEVVVAPDRAAAERLWDARRAVSPALGRLKPNKLGEDIVVPRSRLVEAVGRIRAVADRHGLPIAIFGHAGDGNLHPNILFDRRDPDEYARMQRAAGEIFELAIDLGGTISGEHGVGLLKAEYLPKAVDPGALAVMQAIKAALDPAGIMNPGKLWPSPHQLPYGPEQALAIDAAACANDDYWERKG